MTRRLTPGGVIPGSKCLYCDDEVIARDLCWVHYGRLRTGKPMSDPVERAKECQIPWCKNGCRKYRYCRAHRMRQELWGNPLADAPATAKAEREFWAKTDRSGESLCWPWQGKTFARSSQVQKYGLIEWRGSRVCYAHQIAWLLGTGEKVPDGMAVQWTCGNRLCMNWRHMTLTAKGRHLHNLPPASEDRE
jgi:HNH endonuclease